MYHDDMSHRILYIRGTKKKRRPVRIVSFGNKSRISLILFSGMGGQKHAGSVFVRNVSYIRHS